MDKRLDIIKGAIEDKKGKEILIIELNSESRLFDYMVFVTGNSDKNVKAISDGIEDDLAEIEVFKFQREGYNEKEWILLDYGDIIINILNKRLREYYKLEDLHKNAKIIYENYSE